MFILFQQQSSLQTTIRPVGDATDDPPLKRDDVASQIQLVHGFFQIPPGAEAAGGGSPAEGIESAGTGGGPSSHKFSISIFVKSFASQSNAPLYVALDFTLVFFCKWIHCFPPDVLESFPNSLMIFCLNRKSQLALGILI